MTTMEQAVSQNQREILTIRAQIASRVHEDAPSPTDVNHRGSPKEFSGKEEDFQQWARKAEAFFAEVIKESEMMVEWASDQPMEITTTAIDLEFLPTDSNEGLELFLQHIHETLMTRTSQEANDIVATGGDDYMNDTILLVEEGKGISFAQSFLLDDALFWNSKRELNAARPT